MQVILRVFYLCVIFYLLTACIDLIMLRRVSGTLNITICLAESVFLTITFRIRICLKQFNFSYFYPPYLGSMGQRLKYRDSALPAFLDNMGHQPRLHRSNNFDCRYPQLVEIIQS